MTGAAPPAASDPVRPPSPTASASDKQLARRSFIPRLPRVFSSPFLKAVEVDGESLLNKQDKEMSSPFSLNSTDAAILRSLFPHTIDTAFVRLEPSDSAPAAAAAGAAAGGVKGSSKPLRIGVVLSGGQAAGGHNVICGVYDFIVRIHPDSALYGFLGGPHGVYSGEYKLLTKDIIDTYRNMGGFDMIKSGRHKIETDEQKQASLEVCKKLNLDGLVVIGGDDSNTNAAILAEYFQAHGSSTRVIGCPKTIDGDLKNFFVEISFGFDTACRTYSCSIGNLMMQTLTQRDVYQFVRLMGRSASLLTLECSLRCHPNMTFVGEEVQAKKQSLKELVAMTADLVETRAKLGKLYGVILLPEGLIEFIPEVGVLIQEINSIVAAGEFDKKKLTAASREVLEMLPAHTQQQLLLDRDPHGNVQVALIHTEQLLLELTTEELKRRGFQHPFNGRCTYLGYEGRSGFPSSFDATYCYALGNVAGALIHNGVTSCMAVLKGMSCSSEVEEWVPAGVPLTRMMNLESRKGKDNVPVIKKFLVDIDRPLFKAFQQVREAWKVLDLYLVPGPMQLSSSQLEKPYTLTGPPPMEVLLPAAAAAAASSQQQLQKGCRLYFELLQQLQQLRSPLQQQREAAAIEAPQQLQQQGVVLQQGPVVEISAAEKVQQLQQMFPKSANAKGFCCQLGKGNPKKNKVGIVLVGEAAPGMANVLLGVMEKVKAAGGELFGVLDGKKLISLSSIENEIKMQKNLNAFPLLGRTVLDEMQLVAPGGILNNNCPVDVLIILGGTLAGSAALSEWISEKGEKCKVINVGGASDFCMQDPCLLLQQLEQVQQQQQQRQQMVCFTNTNTNNFNVAKAQTSLRDASGAAGLGFDTQTKAAAELVGNLMTDSNSAAKYFYFCLVGGGRGAEAEVAMQTHPNIVILSALSANLTPMEVAKKIAEDVAARTAKGKNFGVLLMNEDFFITNKPLRAVAAALSMNGGNAAALSGEEAAVFKSLPQTYQENLIEIFKTKGSFPKKAASFPILNCLAAMVGDLVKSEKAAGRFKGSFSPICFNLCEQVRGSIPSAYDCSLGYTMGLASGSLAVSDLLHSLPSAAVVITESVFSVSSISPLVVPLSCAAIACGLALKPKDAAAAAAASGSVAAAVAAGAFDVHLETPTQAAAAAAVSSKVQQQFLLQDKYLNSGPLQFSQQQGAAEADRRCSYFLSARE
ncbi:phosphofructokinase, putative [Eimeria brunetti]|uniref:Pyrophosphate--fructose 6-phosphate 1-phosphotransferase n=1 Tax=Eimeria brunetti TaxID=51314 RepID=U6LTW5_9EIME|nr:phosphofructokinase, putative [Eimeria brunetti]